MSERAAPRRWLAALLSLAVPGWGHAYAGAWRRGLVILLMIAFGLQPLLAAWLLYAPRAGLVAAFVLGPLALIAVASDAAVRARREAPRNASGMRVFAVCLGFLFAGMTLDLAGSYLRDRYVSKTYHVPSEAMLPTLRVGDHLVVDPQAHVEAGPARGDVVVFLAARDRGRILPRDQAPEAQADAFIKRVVGLPGDSILLDGAELYVNGQLATGPGTGETFTDSRGETYEIRNESLDDHRYRVLDHPRDTGRPRGPFVVEADRYFVSGDNRENSNDSRYWGTVHRDDIIGGAPGIYWSWDFRGPFSQLLDLRHTWTLLRERTRWERIGTQID